MDLDPEPDVDGAVADTDLRGAADSEHAVSERADRAAVDKPSVSVPRPGGSRPHLPSGRGPHPDRTPPARPGPPSARPGPEAPAGSYVTLPAPGTPTARGTASPEQSAQEAGAAVLQAVRGRVAALVGTGIRRLAVAREDRPIPEVASRPGPVDRRDRPAVPAARVTTAARVHTPRIRPKAMPDPALPTGALVVQRLTKHFGDTAAVDGLSLVVAPGSILGFVGPNGAGKTTTLMMIAGLLRPDSGRVLVGGIDLWKTPRQAKAMIGVLPDHLRLFDRLTGRQLLAYSASLRGVDRKTTERRTQDLAVAIGFLEALDRPVTDYSSGMAKKVTLAAAMIHSPRVLVLDEPFEGIDPVSTTRIIHILRRFADGGGAVVMSSHSIELVERSCDAVGIVVHGELLAAGPIAEVCDGVTLAERFVQLAGGHLEAEGLEWLGTFSG